MPDVKNIGLESIAIEEMPIPDFLFDIPSGMRVLSMVSYSKELIEKVKTIDNDLQKSNDKLMNGKKPLAKQTITAKPVKTNHPQKNSATKPKE